MASTDLISLGIGGDTTAPIAYFITYGLGDYGGGPPPPPEPGRPQGNLGFGPVVHSDQYYRELEERQDEKWRILNRVRKSVPDDELSEEVVEAISQAARTQTPVELPALPLVDRSNLRELFGLLVEVEGALARLSRLEGMAQRVRNDEDAILALLMA